MPLRRQITTTAKAARVLASTSRAMMRPSIAGPLSGGSCRSRLAVVQQYQADQNETNRPNPAGNPAGGRIEPQFEPSRPARGDAEQRQRDMRQFDEELLLGVDDGMRMRQEQGAAESGDQGKGKCGVRRRRPAGAHPPFEDPEPDDEQHEETMLHDFRVTQTFDQTDIAERPCLGVGTQEQETGEEEEEQRPIARPTRATAAFG